MSTRATYQINGITFYIHSDGYKEGAAHYFFKMLTHPNKCGGQVEMFIRGNELAELARSHEDHVDTEYRYNLHGDKLAAYERTGDWNDPKWTNIFTGSVYIFINQNADLIREYYPDFTPFKPFVRSIFHGVPEYHNTNTIKPIIDKLKAQLEIWEQNGHQNSANYKNTYAELERCLEAFPHLEQYINECEES